MSKNKKIPVKILLLIGILVSGSTALIAYRSSKASTKHLARFHGHRIHDFIHAYIYYKWTKYYLKPIRFILNRPHIVPKRTYLGLGNRLMQSHHAKVIPHETARRLIDVQSPIDIESPEYVLPFERARRIVLENADHIAVIDCPCRQVAKQSCSPIDVCFVLGKPFVEFVLEHKPDSARRLDVDEALQILEREHERGRVHTAWFKDAAGDRFYSICNCCSCCCLGFQAVAMGFGLLASSGFVAEVDERECIACGACEQICPFSAIITTAFACVDTQICKGCGVCKNACPVDAIYLVEDKAKPGPLLIP